MAIYAQSTIVGDGHVGYGSAVSVRDLPDHRRLRRHLCDLHSRVGRRMSAVAEATAGRVAAGQPEPLVIRNSPVGAVPDQGSVLAADRRDLRLRAVPVLLGDPLGVHARGELFKTPVKYCPATSDARELHVRRSAPRPSSTR